MDSPHYWTFIYQKFSELLTRGELLGNTVDSIAAQQDFADQHTEHSILLEDLFQKALGLPIGGDQEVHIGTSQRWK